MQYHLDTIPLWEVMEHHAECPFCALYHKAEQSEIQSSLGGSVMDPNVRIQVNELGFCQKHHRQLFAQKNRLGHALLTDSHCKELLQKLPRSASLPKGNPIRASRLWSRFVKNRMDPLIDRLDALCHGCIVCGKLNHHLERYYYTFLHLWKSNDRFVRLWEASRGVCLPHAVGLLRHGQKGLSSAKLQALADSVLSLLGAALAQDEQALEAFTRQFDYQNQAKPWGNTKTALERTVKRLRGGFGDDDNDQPS